MDATQLDEAAQAALATPDPLPVVRGGGEAILTRYPDPTDDRYADWFMDTLRTPDQELARLDAQHQALVRVDLETASLMDYCKRVHARLHTFNVEEQMQALKALTFTSSGTPRNLWKSPELFPSRAQIWRM